MNEQIKKFTDSLSAEQLAALFIGTLYGLAEVQGIDRDKFITDYIDNFYSMAEQALLEVNKE